MAKELVWSEMRNYAVADASSGAALTRSIIFALKEFLVGNIGPGGAGVWRVRFSSNGTGSYADADTWASPADVVRATTGNHSWCHLANDTLGMEVVLDVKSSQERAPLIMYCAKQFSTNGTATTRPTGTGEWGYEILCVADAYGRGPPSLPASGANTQQFLHNNTSNPLGWNVHGLLSDRGDFWFISGDNYCSIGVCKLLDTKVNDLFPWASYFGGPGDNGAVPLVYSLNRWSLAPFGGAIAGNTAMATRTSGVRCTSFNGVTPDNCTTNSLAGICWPTVVSHMNADPYHSYSPLNSIGATFDSGDGLFLTFPAIVGIAYSWYSTFKGRWPDLLLGPESLQYNTISPLLGAQEWLKVGTVWLPFTGGVLS